MLAAMHGKIDCVLRLLQAGANVSKASIPCPHGSADCKAYLLIMYSICASDLDVRFCARAELPAPRCLLRPCRLPAGHPLGGADDAGGRLMVRSLTPRGCLTLLPGEMSVLLTRCCRSLAGVSPGSSTSGTTTAPRRCISQPGRGGQGACRCCWRTAPLYPL